MSEKDEGKSVKSNGTGKKSGGSKKAPPKEINRSPAGSNEARIMMEQAIKEARCREAFELRAHLFKKPRNPCAGELTSREDAEFLVPLETTLKKLTNLEAYQTYEATRAMELQHSATSVEKFQNRAIKPKDISRLDGLKHHRHLINEELKQLELIRSMNDLNIVKRPY